MHSTEIQRPADTDSTEIQRPADTHSTEIQRPADTDSTEIQIPADTDSTETQRPADTHSMRYRDQLTHIVLRYRYQLTPISANKPINSIQIYSLVVHVSICNSVYLWESFIKSVCVASETPGNIGHEIVRKCFGYWGWVLWWVLVWVLGVLGVLGGVLVEDDGTDWNRVPVGVEFTGAKGAFRQ